MFLGLPLNELLWLAGLLLAGGFALGIMAGLLGIGGGGILIPLLYELFGALGVDDDIRMHLCVGTSLAVIVPTSLRSFRSHRQKGAVDMEIVWSFAPWVVCGVLLGISLAKFSNQYLLKGIWIGAAVLIAGKLFFGRDRWRLGDTIPGNPFRMVYGFFIGVISTIMSIGGGAFVTGLMTLYGRPIHQAVGTSSGFGPMIAIPGALGFMWAGWGVEGLPPGSIGYVNFLGALIIAPVSVLSAPLGVRMAHGISRRHLELAFATFLTLVALRFAVSLL